MASVWEELKRRNVVRTAIAYAIVAWLLLQVADVVLNNTEAPAWVFKAILLALVIGFPLALILSRRVAENRRKRNSGDRYKNNGSQTDV